MGIGIKLSFKGFFFRFFFVKAFVFLNEQEVEKRRVLLQKKTKHGYFGIVKSSNGKWLASRTISSKSGKQISAVCGKSRDSIEEAARYFESFVE